MDCNYSAFWIGIIIPLLLCWSTLSKGNDINHSFSNNNFTHVGVLPYFRANGDLYIALYESKTKAVYTDLAGTRKPNERNIAQTASRVFFPVQQHKNIRTGSNDWPSAKYLEKMLFQGPWARSYLLSMGNESFAYIINVQRPSSLKTLRSYPMIIVRVKDLLDSISPARAIDDFSNIYVIDNAGKSFSLEADFARSLSRGDNWNFLKDLMAA